ncbi:MAG: FAD-dependent oxidoreductase [Hyphomicrobiaceae bacterium]
MTTPRLAAAAAGHSPRAAVLGSDEHTFDAEVDALVVGAGGCGLVAALAAAAHGADVAIVEKLDRLGGNTVLSSGSIPAAGTRFQRDAGIHDDAARFAADLRRVTGPHDAEPLVDALTGISAEMVEWLVDEVGANLELVSQYRHVGHSVNRLHAPPSRRGRDLVDDLWAAVERSGIPVAFGNPVSALLVDGDRVTGVLTSSRDGTKTRMRAGAVVLATNGFGGNKELLRRFCPEIAEATYFGALGSEGEAILWGEQLGAAFANLGAYQAHAGIAQPQGALVTWTVIEKGGFIVDGNGLRFGDETRGYSAFGAEAMRRNSPTFAIYDSRIRNTTAAGQPDFAELVAHGGCHECADLAGVATVCGCPVEMLQATFEVAERASRGEARDPFGRQQWGDAQLWPPYVLRPPYVVTRIAPAIFHTQGGLSVDGNGRVLRADGATIPGLYAGGGAAAGVSGRQGGAGYCSGNGLLGALGLGYLAGRGAALDVRSRGCPAGHHR